MILSGVEERKPLEPSQLPLAPIGSNRTEDLRRRIAAKAKEDLFFLATVVLGYTDLTAHTHGALCRFLDSALYNRRMILMPRNTFKNTLGTIAHTIQLIARNPNISILLISDIEKNASNFLEEIQLHFEHNQMFQWVFPELIPENTNKVAWNSTEMVVPRTKISRAKTIDAIGAFGGAESRHYDYIKADDLATEKSIRSDVEMEKLIRWAGGLESLLADQSGEGWIDFVGSRRKKGDLYEAMEKFFGGDAEERLIGPHALLRGELAVFCRDILEDGESIFPERIPKPFLLRLRKYYPERYHSQYANSPKGTGLNVFEKEWLRYYTVQPSGLISARHNGETIEEVHREGLERIILFDPAVAEKASSSQQALIVLGKGSSNHRYVLETRIGHFPPDEAVEALFELYQRWRPSLISVESRAYQGSIKYWLNEKAERDGLPYLPIVEYPPPAKGSRLGRVLAERDKKEHIRGMQPMVRAGYLWILEEQTELIDQIEFYPNVRFADGLDALAQGEYYFPMLEGEEDITRKKSDEQQFLERVGMLPLLARMEEEESGWSEEKFLQQFDFTGYGMREA